MMRGMMKYFLLLVGLVFWVGPAHAGETPSAEGAKVYFINIKDGQTVSSPFFVQFGLSGMGIAPAGVDTPNTGHHHLIINESIEGEELNEPIPADEQHLHFGKGQTETMLDLKPWDLSDAVGTWGLVAHSAFTADHVIENYRDSKIMLSDKFPRIR